MSGIDGNLKAISVMVAGLREIQELHSENVRNERLSLCNACLEVHPCPTRQLADKALGETS